MTRIALTGLLAALASAQVRYEDILKGPGEHWLTYSGDYTATRHRSLKQITLDNVANLAPKWVYFVEGARKLEVTPIVYDGVMYVTNINSVIALDARTGRRMWKYTDEQAQGQRNNRGAAILGDRVFFNTSDCHMVALHRKTGAVLWHKKYADTKQGYFATLAPLALKDRVITGVGGGDSGMRGFVAALSASTGEELWRFYTVPARGEPGAESWGSFPLEWAGAATWLTGTFDPGTNLLYWMAGNPWPDFYGGDRKGDNLYSNSVIALDADTGKLRWYFQFTPHDVHDWDAQAIPILLDADWKGQKRRLLVKADRNGFFYVLDRETGEFLLARRFADKLNWATGIDAKGKPVRVPDMEPTPGGKRVCPAVRGAANWMSPSYNPETRLFYFPVLESCDIYYSSAKNPEPMAGFAGTGGEQIPAEPGKFYLRAIDPLSADRKWEYPMTGPTTMWAGTVSTGGGLVFFGDDDGHLVAVDARNGKHLWHFPTSQNLTASPITYMAGGKQFVAIAAGTHVWSFGLFEPAQSVPVVPERETP